MAYFYTLNNIRLNANQGMSVSPGSFGQQVADGARNRQLHPFPADDPFNMPLGVNAWYAPSDDPASQNVVALSAGLNVNNGWSHPIYFSTTSDPLHTISINTGKRPNQRVESYLSEENGQLSLQEYLSSSATPATPNTTGWVDGHLHIIRNNDLVEGYVWERTSPTSATNYRLVRNRLDHYAHAGGSNPLRNRSGTRAWGGSAIAGLIRKHEVDTADPYIPHAVPIVLNINNQIGKSGHGNASSPLYNIDRLFPASTQDGHGYPNSTGSARMGMRFALDPTVATDSWLAGISNIYHRAIARALRDYGCIVCDGTGGGRTILQGEQGISSAVEDQMRNWGWMTEYLRRVAGDGPVHNPLESHWDAWRANGQGWGGGAPRVPYSSPLAPL